MSILLRTVHGSHLYNLNHDNSDTDYYEVYSGKGRAKQTIVGDIDTLRISYDSFMFQCRKGVPQALEALYSPVKEIDEIPFITDSFNPISTEVYKTYVRTIRNFWKEGSLKRKRHAVRLCINLSCIMRYGRFNPSLTQIEKIFVVAYGDVDEEECPALNMLGFPLYIW